jgi:hypothetical protein
MRSFSARVRSPWRRLVITSLNGKGACEGAFSALRLAVYWITKLIIIGKIMEEAIPINKYLNLPPLGFILSTIGSPNLYASAIAAITGNNSSPESVFITGVDGLNKSTKIKLHGPKIHERNMAFFPKVLAGLKNQ